MARFGTAQGRGPVPAVDAGRAVDLVGGPRRPQQRALGPIELDQPPTQPIPAGAGRAGGWVFAHRGLHMLGVDMGKGFRRKHLRPVTAAVGVPRRPAGIILHGHMCISGRSQQGRHIGPVAPQHRRHAPVCEHPVPHRRVDQPVGRLRAQPRGGHAEGDEDALMHHLLPGHPADRFNHHPGDEIAKVRILEWRAFGYLDLVVLPLVQQLRPERVGVVVKGAVIEIEREDLVIVARNAAGMRQQLLQRGGGKAVAQAGMGGTQNRANSCVPGQKPLFHHHTREGGGHGFGVRADVEPVVKRDGNIAACNAGANRRDRRDLTIDDHRSREGGQSMLDTHCFKVSIQFACRGRAHTQQAPRSRNDAQKPSFVSTIGHSGLLVLSAFFRTIGARRTAPPPEIGRNRLFTQ